MNGCLIKGQSQKDKAAGKGWNHVSLQVFHSRGYALNLNEFGLPVMRDLPQLRVILVPEELS